MSWADLMRSLGLTDGPTLVLGGWAESERCWVALRADGPAPKFMPDMRHEPNGCDCTIDASAVRADGPAPWDLTPSELSALAHELGHFVSHRQGTAPEHLDDPRLMTPEQVAALSVARRGATVAEEVLAWDIAKVILEAVGFAAWPTFDANRDEALAGYAKGLGVELPASRGEPLRDVGREMIERLAKSTTPSAGGA